MKDRSTRGILRCAIYTRVSTDQGLEQDFSSLDGRPQKLTSRARRMRAGD